MSFSQYPQNPVTGKEYTVGQIRVLWDGQKFVSVPPILNGNISSVSSIEELRAKAASLNGEQISLSGYYAGSTKGGGVFVWNAASTAADDGGVTIAVTGVTTGRWVRQLDEYVTPEMFGARGDGVTDDTARIQSAVDYANVSGIKNIQSGGGCYVCSNLLMRSNTTLSGVRLKTAATSPDGSFCVSIPSGVECSSIENSSIDGNDVNVLNNIVGGVFVAGENNSVVNCDIFDVKRSGVSIGAGSNNVKVSRNNIKSVGRSGIVHGYSSILYSSNLEISFNRIINTGSAGISVIAGDDANGASAGIRHSIITGNMVSNTGLTEIAGSIGLYSPNNYHVIVSNNITENANNHMHHVGGEFISVTGNTAKGLTSSAILVRNWPNNSQSTMCKNVSVCNNLIETTATDGNGQGIDIVHCDGFVVSGNTISSTINSAIAVRGERLGSNLRSKNGTVSGNKVSSVGVIGASSTKAGVEVTNSDSVTVSANSINGCINSGVRVQGSTFINVNGNQSSENGESGVLIIQSDGSTQTENVVVSGNSCTNNGNFGILVTSGVTRVNIANNICRMNTVGQIGYPSGITSSVIKDNLGFRTRGQRTASVSNGSTVPHFIEGIPTSYSVTPLAANRVAAITSVSASSVTLSLTDMQGNPITVNENVNFTFSSEIN